MHFDKSPNGLTNYYPYGSIEHGSSSSSSSTVAPSPTPSLSTLSSVYHNIDEETSKHITKDNNKQELKRSLSAFTTFGLSFSNIGILASTSVTFQTALQRGGSISVLLGWNVVAILSICISLSLAELCSVYATSGGIYIWIYELMDRHPATKKHATFISNATGCNYVMGMLISIAAIDVSIALSFGSLLKIFTNDGLSHSQVLGLTLFIVTIQAILNCGYTAVLNWLNKLNVFWSCAGLFLVVIGLSFFASSHQDPVWVFTHYENKTGFDSPYYVFILGMMGSAYSLCGSEGSAAMSEETENANLAAPIAMVTSIMAAWIFGLIYMLVLLFSIQDIDAVLNTSFNLPVAQIFYDAVGTGATIGFLCLIIVCQFCSASTAMTVCSRQIFAMARSGGIPFHRQLCQLNNQQIPAKAVIACFVLVSAVVLPYPLSDHIFVVIISAATITTNATYAIALGCKLFIGMGGKKGPFRLGRFSKPITILAFTWSIFAVVAFALPTSWPMDVTNINYAGPALCILILVTYSMLSLTSTR